MPGLGGVLTFTGIAGVSSADKTIAWIKAPSDKPIRVTAIRLGCSGVSATDPPVLVKLATQTTDGSSTGTSTPSPVLTDTSLTATLSTTCKLGPSSGAWSSSEPTTTDIKYMDRIHPQGRIPDVFVKPEIWVKAGDRIGLIVNVGSGAVNSFSGALYFDE